MCKKTEAGLGDACEGDETSKSYPVLGVPWG